MGGYVTRQRTLILAFLQRHSGRSFTAGEVHQDLVSQMSREMAPARSTVFRVLRRLAEEGAVMRLPREGTRAYAYQVDGHEACEDCLHLMCQDCGRLIHLDSGQTQRLLEAVRQQLHFEMDQQHTTLYGRCLACKTQGGTP